MLGTGADVRYARDRARAGLALDARPADAARARASTTRAARSTRSTPSASSGSLRGAVLCRLAAAALQPLEPRRRRLRARPDGLPAAPLAEGDARDRRRDPLPDRERPDGGPHLAARHGRPDLGVVDRRPHRDRADPPRPAGDPADPLDAEPPDPRPGDEGDPAALQGRPAEAERRADEVLQGEQDQPVRVVPADRLPDPDLHRALLRPPRLRGRDLPAVRRSPPSSGSISSTSPSPRRTAGGRCSSSSTSISQLTSTWLMSTSMQSAAQRCDDHGAPDRLHPVHPQLPLGPDDLLADDEPLDDRAGARHAPPDAATRCAPEAVEPDAARRRRSRRSRRSCSPRTAPRRRAAPARRTRPRRVKKKKRRREAAGDERRTRARRGDRRDGGRGEVVRASRSSSGSYRASTARASSSRSSPRASAVSSVSGTRRRTSSRAPLRLRTHGGRDAPRPGRPASSSTASRRRSARASRVGRRAGGRGHRHVLRRGPRAADREARADDRRDPVPRERGRSRSR